MTLTMYHLIRSRAHDARRPCQSMWVCLVLLAALALPYELYAAPDAADDAAWLMQLYESTNGDGWNSGCQSIDGWQWASLPLVCSWTARITCSNERVTLIDLGGCNLQGTLPPLNTTSGALSDLQHLYLNANRLTSTLPPNWSSLSSLQRLWLDSNDLYGPLPSSYTTGLVSLHSYPDAGLYLSDNCLNLSSVPSSELSWWNSRGGHNGIDGGHLRPQRRNCPMHHVPWTKSAALNLSQLTTSRSSPSANVEKPIDDASTSAMTAVSRNSVSAIALQMAPPSTVDVSCLVALQMMKCSAGFRTTSNSVPTAPRLLFVMPSLENIRPAATSLSIIHRLVCHTGLHIAVAVTILAVVKTTHAMRPCIQEWLRSKSQSNH